MFTLKKVEPLLKETYIAVINNSVGSVMFRNSFARIEGKKVDINTDGKTACSFHVSSTLMMFGEHGLIKTPHGVTASTVLDMEYCGWVKIKTPKIGAVLIWEEKFGNGEANEHCGFYVGKQMAVSNSPKIRKVIKHHWTYGGTAQQPSRKVTAIYWHAKLD